MELQPILSNFRFCSFLTSFLAFLLGKWDPHSLRDKVAEVVSNNFKNLKFVEHILLKDATEAELVLQKGGEPEEHEQAVEQPSGCMVLATPGPVGNEVTPAVPETGSMSDSLLESFAGMSDLCERLDGSEWDDLQRHVRTALSHPLFSSFQMSLDVEEGCTFGGEGEDDDALEDVLNWYGFLSKKITEFGSVTAAVSSLATTSRLAEQKELQPHGSIENHGGLPEKIVEVDEIPAEKVNGPVKEGRSRKLVVPKNCDRQIVMRNDSHLLFNTASWGTLSRRIREEDMNAKLLSESLQQQKPKVAEPKDWKPVQKSNQEQFDLLLSGQALPASKFELDIKTQVNKEIQREVAKEVPKSRDMREMFKAGLPTNSATVPTVPTETLAATEAHVATETPSATAAAAATAAPVESLPLAPTKSSAKSKAEAKEKAAKKAKVESKKKAEKKRGHSDLSGATAPLSEAFKKGRK